MAAEVVRSTALVELAQTKGLSLNATLGMISENVFDKKGFDVAATIYLNEWMNPDAIPKVF